MAEREPPGEEEQPKMARLTLANPLVNQVHASGYPSHSREQEEIPEPYARVDDRDLIEAIYRVPSSESFKKRRTRIRAITRCAMD
jgi:hypothetical protein